MHEKKETNQDGNAYIQSNSCRVISCPMRRAPPSLLPTIILSLVIIAVGGPQVSGICCRIGFRSLPGQPLPIAFRNVLLILIGVGGLQVPGICSRVGSRFRPSQPLPIVFGCVLILASLFRNLIASVHPVRVYIHTSGEVFWMIHVSQFSGVWQKVPLTIDASLELLATDFTG